MRKQEKIGYGVLVVVLLLFIVGTVGYTIEGEVNDVPTPNAPQKTFFADEPLPEQTLRTLVSATLTLTWDRDDAYVVIADEDEKNTCTSLPTGLFPNSEGCGPTDSDVVAGGMDGQEGLTWDVEAGVYFAGVGTNTEGLPQGSEVNIFYEVHIKADFVTYFILALIAAAGFAYTRVE